MSRLRKIWREKIKPRWYKNLWLIVAVLWLSTLALGFIGFSGYFSGLGEYRPISDRFYLTLQLFVLESGSAPGPKSWELEIARLMAPAIMTLTVIEALAVIFRDQIQIIRLRFRKGHVVICGLGRKGLLLAERFVEDGKRVVIIERDEENTFIAQSRDLGAVVLVGNCAGKKMLHKAGVARASHLIAVSGSDGVNAQVSVIAHELKREQGGRSLFCSAHVTDTHLCDLLRERQLMIEDTLNFQPDFFSIFDRGARAMLDEYPPYDEEGNEACPGPHLLVIGLGKMGESLIVRAARDWIQGPKVPGAPLRVTILDREANWKTESLRVRYPQLEGFWQLAPVQMDVRRPEFLRPDFVFGADSVCSVTYIYVCLDNDSLGLMTALSLSGSIRNRRIPIVVRMEHDRGLASLLKGESPAARVFGNMHAFGLLERTCTPDLVTGGVNEILARATHDAYIKHREQDGASVATDPAMAPWDELDESLRESSRQQAGHIGAKLRAVGCDIEPLRDPDAATFEFTPDEVELMTRMEHERWVRERIDAGWKPGPRDSGGKTTPYLVPWDELSDEIKEYDRNPVRELPAFLANAGYQARRLDRGNGGIS